MPAVRASRWWTGLPRSRPRSSRRPKSTPQVSTPTEATGPPAAARRRPAVTSPKRRRKSQWSVPASVTGTFAKRWTSWRARRPPSNVPTTARPLSAPRSTATRRSGESVKAEHLLEASVEARRRVRAGVDEGRHVRLPAGVDRRRVHHGPEAAEIVDFEAAEQVLVSLVDRIVAAARRAQRVEHLRPHCGVTPPVLGLRPGQELHREGDTFHGVPRAAECQGPGGRWPPGPRDRARARSRTTPRTGRC